MIVAHGGCGRLSCLRRMVRGVAMSPFLKQLREVVGNDPLRLPSLAAHALLTDVAAWPGER